LTKNTYAILWDMDGTIIDTTACHFSTWKTVLSQHGYLLDSDVYAANFGRNTRAVLSLFLGFEPEPELMERLIAEKSDLFRELAPIEAQLIPGVEGWLSTAKAYGIPQVIASSGSIENIQTMMSSFNLIDYFHQFVSGADLPAKPEPDVFLEAARQLNRKPEECLVIEDSLPGVKAAKNAGMTCIAVTTTLPQAELSIADRVVDDFTYPLLPLLADLGFEVR
jgi:beta-phosphoglucomutase